MNRVIHPEPRAWKVIKPSEGTNTYYVTPSIRSINHKRLPSTSYFFTASPFFGGGACDFLASGTLGEAGRLGFGLVESQDATDDAAGDAGGELFADPQGDLAGDDGAEALLHHDSSSLLCHAVSLLSSLSSTELGSDASVSDDDA